MFRVGSSKQVGMCLIRVNRIEFLLQTEYIRVMMLYIIISCCLTLHGFLDGRSVSFSKLDFVVCLAHHASRGTHKDNVRSHSRALGGAIEGITADTDLQTTQSDRCEKDAIVASNQTNVVLVESQSILFSQHNGGGGDSRSGANANLETETGDGAGFFSHLARLKAAAASVVPLAAFVVAPSGIGIDVIQNLFAHVHLTAQTADHRSTPTTWFFARSLTECDLKLVGILGKLPVSRSVLSLADFIVVEGFFREAKEAHHFVVSLINVCIIEYSNLL
mmetsp:Transcript_14640/g.36833  ORF Transcript_14640/g.36833 Transcript_14640/m.36833 type:complete len:276 (+) Transcript_14640:45-872(+)